MAKKNEKNVKEIELQEFAEEKPEFEVSKTEEVQIMEDHFDNKEPDFEVQKNGDINIEDEYVAKEAEKVQWEKEEERIQKLFATDDKDLTAREMQEKYGIMRGRNLTVDGKDVKANNIDQKEVQNAYTEKFKEIDDKRQAEIAEERAYRAVADKNDKELSAEEMMTKYRGRMARGEEVPDDIWDKIEAKDFKAKYGNATIKKDTEQLKEEAEQKKKAQEEKRDKKREEEFKDINKGIEELGEPDNLPDNADNEIDIDLFGDEQEKKENKVKHAQLFEEIVTDELEGLEGLEQAADKIKNDEPKPVGYNETFDAIQKANEAANKTGRFEVGEGGPQIDYVKLMMQNNPMFKNFLDLTNPKKEEPVNEVKPEENKPEQVNNEAKPEEQKKEEKQPEFERFEVEEYVDEVKESIIANNDPKSTIVKNYKKEQEKAQKKEEKREKELQDKLDEAFAPAKEGEDQKEIDENNKLFKTEEEEKQSLENQVNQAENKEAENVEEEKTPEEREAKEKDDLFDKYHPGLKGKRERGEEISEKEADKNFEVPLGTRNEILDEINGGEENHRPDASIVMWFKLLVNALIPALFAKECAEYHKANAEYYKMEAKIENAAKEKYKKERDGIEKKYAEQKKAREAAEKEKKAEERERRLEEHNKKLEELLAQKNDPQKDVNVPQGNSTAEINQNKELGDKKDSKEIEQNAQTSVQNEKKEKEVENKDLQETKQEEKDKEDPHKDEKDLEKNLAPEESRHASKEQQDAFKNYQELEQRGKFDKGLKEIAQREMAEMLYDKIMANMLERTNGPKGKELYAQGMKKEVREKGIEKLLNSNDKAIKAALDPSQKNIDKLVQAGENAPQEIFDTYKSVHKLEKERSSVQKAFDKNYSYERSQQDIEKEAGVGMGAM